MLTSLLYHTEECQENLSLKFSDHSVNTQAYLEGVTKAPFQSFLIVAKFFRIC